MAKKKAAKPSAKQNPKKPAKKAAPKKASKASASNDENKEEKPKIAKVATKSLSIAKVNLNGKGFLTIILNKLESDSSSTAVTEEHKNRTAHPDLIECFNNLRIHFALLHESISIQQLKRIDDYNPDLVEKYHVTSIRIKEKNASEGYVISGYKTLSNGKTTPGFATPFTMKEEEESSRYKYMPELSEVVDELLTEVDLYRSGEKVGDAQQPELGFPADNDDENDNLGGDEE